MSTPQPGIGFAPDESSLAERRALARHLVGRRVERVEYVNIDYRGWDLGHQDPNDPPADQ